MCVAGVHPEVVSYCPWLPMVIAGCLHWMDERDSFAVAIALIREPSPLLMSRISSWKMLQAFDQLARANLGGEFAKLCRHTGVRVPGSPQPNPARLAPAWTWSVPPPITVDGVV